MKRKKEAQDLATITDLGDIQLTDEQKEASKNIDKFPVNILYGDPGTGKTRLSVQKALDLIQKYPHTYYKIILIRPAVAVEKLGHLPGDLEQKYDVYLQPFFEFFSKLGKYNGYTADHMVKSGLLEKAPVAFLRGTNFENSVVLVDEAQNLTNEQMKLILTRLCKQAKIIFTGDLKQKDISGESGFKKLLDMSNKEGASKYIYSKELKTNHRSEFLEFLFENW